MYSSAALEQYLKCDGVGTYHTKKYTNFTEKYIQSSEYDRGKTLYEIKYVTPTHDQIYFIYDNVKWINFDKVDDIPRLNSWLLSGRYHNFRSSNIHIENIDFPQIMHNIIYNAETNSNITFCLNVGNHIDLKQLSDKYKGYNWYAKKIFVNKDEYRHDKLDYVCAHLRNICRYAQPIIQFNNYDMASSPTILENSNMDTLMNPFNRRFNIYVDKIDNTNEFIQQMTNNVNALNDVYSKEKMGNNDYIMSRYVWNITIGYININDLRVIVNMQFESKFNHFIFNIEKLDMTNNTNNDDVIKLKRLCNYHHKNNVAKL